MTRRSMMVSIYDADVPATIKVDSMVRLAFFSPTYLTISRRDVQACILVLWDMKAISSVLLECMRVCFLVDSSLVAFYQ